MAEEEQNPLLSHQKSDIDLQVALHPLVLLTISDYITRHTLRRQEGPIVGALLGAQHGREISIEHAFECMLEERKNDSGEATGDIALAKDWFEHRLSASKCTLCSFPCCTLIYLPRC